MTNTGAGEPPTAMPPKTMPPISDDSQVGARKGGAARIIVAAIVVLALVAAVTIAVTIIGGGSAEAQVTLRSLGSSGDDQFTPAIAAPPSATLADYAENGSRDAAGLTAEAIRGSGSTPVTGSATLSDYRQVSGDVPGVFGGSLDERTCDVDQLVSFLATDAEKAQAWAGVLGIDAGDIGSYADTLTAANVAADTRVLDHGFASGAVVPREAVLQRGSAVLVDARGVPRVDCYSGNPLRNPTIRSDETFVGAPWPSFSTTDVVVVEPAASDVTEFVLVDVADGSPFVRPVGSTGEADEQADDGADDAEPTPRPEATVAPVTRELNMMGVIDVNSPMSLEILRDDDELIFEFDAPPGAKLTVKMANDRSSVGGIAFELLRDGRSYDFVRVPQGGADEIALTLDHESGGRYEVVVTEGPGAFDLVVQSEMQDDAGQGRDAPTAFADALAVGSGQNVDGHLAGVDKADTYVIELRDAPALVMTARAARETSRPAFELEILGESITFFRVNPADEHTFEMLFGPEDDGLLELYVTEGPSEYGFVVELVPQNDAGSGGDAASELAEALVVDSADEIAGEVGQRDSADYYLFPAPADEFTLSIEISPRALGRIGVDVLGPDGTRIDFFRVEPGATGSVNIDEPGTEGEEFRLVISEGRGEYSVSIDS